LSEHPTPAELDAFLAGSLARGRFREVSRHLLHGCADCQTLLARGFAAMEPLPESVPVIQAGVDYDRALDAAFGKLRSQERYFRREEARGRKVALKLAAAGSLRAVIDGTDITFRGLGALTALLEQSWALRTENQREMVSLARAAVNVARRLNPRRFAPELRADLEAWAWGELANALRARDDLDEAERAFGTAFDLFDQGTGAPHLKARLYDLHASYLGTRRRFGLAFEALDTARATYLELGESHLAGKALVVKAVYTFYSGRPEEAIRLNEEGSKRIRKGLDPDLDFSVILNHLLFLVDCGRCSEAKKALFLLQKDIQRLNGRIQRLRLRWIQGRISAGLGEWESAEQAFTEVKDGLEEAGMGFHAALASLDLALLWMRQDRYAEAEDLALETVEVFVALRVRREAFGALMILKDAFEKQTATVSLLEDVVGYLRWSQVDPDAPFVQREG
jgi:tetratricopeptide (TPR) repeat protein